MALADSVILPFNVTHYGVNLKYFNEKLLDKFADDFKSNGVLNETGYS